MKLDPVLSVKSSDPYHLLGPIKRSTIESQKSGLGSVVSNVLDTSTSVVGKSISMVKPVVISIFGLFGLIGGGIMKTFFKDHTAADAGSLVLMILGGILGVFGLYDFGKAFNNQKAQLQKNVEHTHEKVSDKLGTECKKAEKDLAALDPVLRDKEAISITKGVLSSNKANNIRAQVLAVLSKYTDPELKVWVNNYASGIEPALVNISKEPVSRSDFRDRIALLLGNAVSSRSDDNDLSINYFGDILRTPELIQSPSSDATDDIKQAEIVNMLPEDFAIVFNVARYYADNHRLKNNSLNGLIGDDNDIKILETLVQKPHESEEKKYAKVYLDQLQNAENYFNVLKSAIDYVLSKSTDPDEKTLRNITILRQALVCGLRIKAKDSAEIDKRLREVKNGVSAGGVDYVGLDDKVKLIKGHQDTKIEPIRLNEDKDKRPVLFPFERQEKSMDEICFLSGVNLSEYSEKPIE